jgi:hypothetical protein
MTSVVLEPLVAEEPPGTLTLQDQDAIKRYLEAIDRRTAGDTYPYVMTGAPPQALSDIAARIMADASTRAFRWQWTQRAAEGVLLTLQGWDAAVVRRLGEVLVPVLGRRGYRWPEQPAGLELIRALACVTE